MSEDADGFSWEAIIRAVTMAGRPDRVFELQLAYNKYFQILDAASRTLRDIRGRLSEKDWSGSGADAYRRHYDSLVKAIDTFYEKTSTVVELSGDTGGALARAIADIPLPDMGDVDHLGMHGIQYSDAESGNQVQYHFFRTHRGRYDDGGFLTYVNDQIDSGHIPKSHQARYHDHAKTWYSAGTHRARAAFRTLLDAYSEQTHAIPTDPNPSFGRDSGYTDDGSGDGSGSTGGASFGGHGYGALGSGSHPSIGAPPPPVRGHDGSRLLGGEPGTDAGSASPTWSDPDGSKLAGGSGATAAAAGSAPSDSIGLGQGSGIGGGSAFGGGSAGRYDPAGGYGGAAMPAAGSRGVPGGVGAGRGTAASAGGNTYGGVPGSSAGGKKERDERRSWLTEDDDEVWRPKNLAPKTNSAGAIE